MTAKMMKSCRELQAFFEEVIYSVNNLKIIGCVNVNASACRMSLYEKISIALKLVLNLELQSA